MDDDEAEDDVVVVAVVVAVVVVVVDEVDVAGAVVVAVAVDDVDCGCFWMRTPALCYQNESWLDWAEDGRGYKSTSCLQRIQQTSSCFFVFFSSGGKRF